MIQYPTSFFAASEATSGIQTDWFFESQNQQIRCSVPTEFEGPGGALSPEDLFAQALTNCFVATFKVYAEKSRLNFKSLTAKSELIVDLNEEKKPIMKRLVLNVDIFGAENPDRIKFIAQKAFESGFILNSVKTEVTFNLNLI
ncbi:MAG: OsmC family protein [Bdellovibrio sp.]|nr:OsmC family protein [Bdellovibrio sp.]